MSGAAASSVGRSRGYGLKLEPGALIVLAAGLRFGSLRLQSFWFDEAVTGYVVSRPGFGDVIDAVTRGESTPPLFHVLVWLAAKVGGQGRRSTALHLGPQRDRCGKSAVTTLGKPREQRALVVIPGYAMPPVARYGHFGFDATKRVRAKELVVIGVFDSRGAPARSIGGLTLAGRRQIQHIGIARYRSRKAVTLREAQFAPAGAPRSTPHLYVEETQAAGAK